MKNEKTKPGEFHFFNLVKELLLACGTKDFGRKGGWVLMAVPDSFSLPVVQN